MLIFSKPLNISLYYIIILDNFMIILHNHPGGSLKPSNDDIFLTKEFIKLGRMMEIPITDHIIVTNAGYYSIRLNFPDLFIAI